MKRLFFDYLNVASGALFVAFVLWLFVGMTVFSVRHPWATDTEKWICIKEVLLFEKVPYSELRPRE